MKLTAQLTHLPLGILVSVASWAADTKCINIYYDQVPNSKPVYIESRLDAINLQNLLGHFPQYQQYVSPIHLYKKMKSTAAKLHSMWDHITQQINSFLNPFMKILLLQINR